MNLLQGQNKSNEFYKTIMYVGRYPGMAIDDNRRRPRGIPDRPASKLRRHFLPTFR